MLWLFLKRKAVKAKLVQGFLRVMPESKVYDVMQQVHCKELNHAGYKKYREYVSILFPFPFFLIINYLFTENSS